MYTAKSHHSWLRQDRYKWWRYNRKAKDRRSYSRLGRCKGRHRHRQVVEEVEGAVVEVVAEVVG